MNLFSSIGKNFSFFSVHLNIWLFKFLIIYFSFEPIRMFSNQFFANKTINKRLMDTSDSSALFELLWQAINTYGNLILPIIIGIIVISIFMLVMDSLIDCGLLAVYYTGNKKVFLSSVKENANKMILLKLLLIIPYTFMIVLISFPLFTLYNPITYHFPIGTYQLYSNLFVLLLLASPALFILKAIDYAKTDLLVNKSSVGSALTSGLRQMFENPLETIVINLFTLILFCLGFLIFHHIDNWFIITDSVDIFIAAVLFQIVILLKQILRYSFTGTVIDRYFLK